MIDNLMGKTKSDKSQQVKFGSIQEINKNNRMFIFKYTLITNITMFPSFREKFHNFSSYGPIICQEKLKKGLLVIYCNDNYKYICSAICLLLP